LIVRKREELADPNSCLNRAHDDEWLFVLIGRDVSCPDTIRFWAGHRVSKGKNRWDDPEILEALRAADTIEAEQARGA
jgi:hypothetical protein